MALPLCPDHPDAANIEVIAEMIKNSVSPGSKIIGKDMKPGVYETYKDRVEDCYWELSDSQGNIIDNNFVSVAGRLTVNTAGAYGFTSRSCGEWKLVQ